MALPACVSLGPLQTANVLGKGHYELALEPAAQSVLTKHGMVVNPHGDIAARYGFTERLDLGLRAGSSGLVVTSKYQLTARQNLDRILSLAPSLGGLVRPGIAGTGADVYLDVPLLYGMRVGQRNQLVLGAKVQIAEAIEGTDVGVFHAEELSLGASAAFAWRVNARLTLLPELAIQEPVVSFSHTASGPLVGASAVLLQVACAVLWGGGG